MKQDLSVRRTVAGLAVGLVVVSLVTSLTLVYLTTLLHRASTTISASVESVRLVEEIRHDLLLHGRAEDPVVRDSLVAATRQKLADAERYVTSRAEAATLHRASAALERYFRTELGEGPSVRSAQLDDAYFAVGTLIDINVADAREQQAKIAEYDEVSDFIGAAAGVLLVMAAGWLVWWLNTRAFRQVLVLGETMERFARGDRKARATVGGPAELAEMARRFNDLADSLARQREEQMAFLAGVAHDLRNPLSALRASSALVRPERPLPAEGHIRAAAQLVQRQVERLERMVSDLLDTARIEAGQISLEKAPHDLREVARGVLRLFEGTSPAHTLRLSEESTPLIVDCDAHRLEQVLNNLVSNAIKYSPDGGTIEVSVAKVPGEARLAVVDAGLGIAEDEFERIFEPFRRSRGQAAQIAGVGLGLFVAREIVRAHGGRMTVDSTLGAGSRFEVRLPLGGLEPARSDERTASAGHRIAPTLRPQE